MTRIFGNIRSHLRAPPASTSSRAAAADAVETCFDTGRAKPDRVEIKTWFYRPLSTSCHNSSDVLPSFKNNTATTLQADCRRTIVRPLRESRLDNCGRSADGYGM